ncbi:MAG TPA: tetratricopeptide repeat protein [Methylophilaceae bacterium]|nr:tetratricopeptide repeat protein [Methylophilaceae bacterium]
MQDRQIEQLESAIRRAPQDPELHYDLGNLLLGQRRPAEAESSFLAALRLAPGHPQILLQLGNARSAQGRYADAVSQFQAALRADPAQPAAHYNLGNALREMGQPEQAAASYRAALKLDPRDADSHNNLGNVLREMGKLDEAIARYREALRLNPGLHHARMHLLHQRQHVCDWAGMDDEIAEIRRLVREEPRAQISPFAFLALPGTTAAEQRLCAEHWAENRLGQLVEDGKRLAYPHTRENKFKLKIGYLSADFRQHPLAWLATELMELHDRESFEVHGYSYGPDDHSPARRRWEQAFDHFRDIRDLSMHEAARKIHADGIDILVDLTGFTHSSRSGILALRPAPLQVNWLGFPGSMGAPFVDYLISDSFITPPEQAQHYAEQLALLPDTYQPNDRQRPLAATPSRAECGLPEHGFVFCCFNQTFKITPQLSGLWLGLLKSVPGSVLWLLECNPWAKANLRREIAARGVEPGRLIFAPRVPIEQHLARHRCADLFLDTLPYNAHTTTSDALWMGLPLVTCAGETFAARVAGSLLRAAGFPQLVTGNLHDYQALALRLATSPDELHALRTVLAQQCDTAPLFDTPRFARHLQQAYRAMWQRYASGQPPQAINLAEPQ